MPRAGYPRRPGSTVIPASWSAQHRPTAEGTFTAVCEITADGTDTWDPVAGENVEGPRPVLYTGQPCRVQQLGSPGVSEVGQQDITSLSYLVAVPSTVANVEVGHRVEVTAVDDNGDPTLIGRPLTITNVQRGSLQWERDLICIDDLG